MARSSKFYWWDGQTETILLEGTLEQDDVLYGVGFYDSEDEAYDSLDRMVESDSFDYDRGEVMSLKLKKSGHGTVGEAADALTEQGDLFEF